MNRCLQPYRRRPPLYISEKPSYLEVGNFSPRSTTFWIPGTSSNTLILNENARKKDAMFAFTEFSQVDPHRPERGGGRDMPNGGVGRLRIEKHHTRRCLGEREIRQMCGQKRCRGWLAMKTPPLFLLSLREAVIRYENGSKMRQTFTQIYSDTSTNAHFLNLRSDLRKKNVSKPCSGSKMWFSVDAGQNPNFIYLLCALPEMAPASTPTHMHNCRIHFTIYIHTVL